jgi:hypothetical protein
VHSELGTQALPAVQDEVATDVSQGLFTGPIVFLGSTHNVVK